MPPKNINNDLIRCHVMIDKKDHEEIMSLYGEHPGFSAAIRIMIHKYLEHIRAKGLKKAQPEDHLIIHKGPVTDEELIGMIRGEE